VSLTLLLSPADDAATAAATAVAAACVCLLQPSNVYTHIQAMETAHVSADVFGAVRVTAASRSLRCVTIEH
jgi:hypothetical protein